MWCAGVKQDSVADGALATVTDATAASAAVHFLHKLRKHLVRRHGPHEGGKLYSKVKKMLVRVANSGEDVSVVHHTLDVWFADDSTAKAAVNSILSKLHQLLNVVRCLVLLTCRTLKMSTLSLAC